MKTWKKIGSSLLALTVLLQTGGIVEAKDGTTKYRVYQKQTMLKEFASSSQARAYASGFRYSHVEEIATRNWVWHNFPKFKVYHQGISKPEWEYITLDSAMAEAKKSSDSSIRDLETAGWVWNNYAKYRLFQGDRTIPAWGYPDLASAKREAAKYANMHVIDESTGAWIWDNITPALEKKLRMYGTVYQVRIADGSTEMKSYALLEDAVKAAWQLGSAEVVHALKGTVVYSSMPAYTVYQNEKELKSYRNVFQAISYAKSFARASIRFNGNTVWTNTPYYRVKQNDKVIREVQSLKGGLALAKGYTNTSVETADGITAWDNFRKLVYLGWNGSGDASRIEEQVTGTQGLDIDSPTWFVLKDGNGNVEDTSSKETVERLKEQGIEVHPLVQNQFNAALTSQLLSNPAAQMNFIRTVVDRTASIGAPGINLDFEGMSAKDRDKFTAFVRMFTDYAHKSQITVSIDLPRGSLLWNDKTAIDHAKLAEIVDTIIIMAYDQHYKGSEKAGSVAGLSWVEEGIKEFLSYGMERKQLMLGIPFYVRQWQIDASGQLVSNKALLMSEIPALLEQKQAVKTWDPEFGQYKVEYAENGFRYVFWLENEATVKARVQLAKKYDLGGVAAWRLGYEPETVWTEMLRLK
ncbi:glycosyl hydrolase family 18 protein [Paenibacillus gansuensis]|uniref:Glycosyl hydrolase family 18 protein n=1 Tax=Paenibacillus gansuensis TaxID=306542 RepID=A0ABW5PAT0_9BACL